MSTKIQVPNLGAGSLGSVPPVQSGHTTPNLGLSLDCPATSALNFARLDGSVISSLGTFSKIQLAQSVHVITTNDIDVGYAVTPIVWPTPWPDTNYSVVSGILSTLADGDFGVGATHSVTPAGCNITTILLSAVPVVQGQFNAVDLETSNVYTFAPPIPPPPGNVFEVTIVMIGTATNPAPFAGAQIQASITYDDTFGAQAAILNTTNTNSGPSGLEYPIFSTSGAPMVITTNFITYQVSGTSAGNFYGPPDTVTQHVTGATAVILNSPPTGGGSSMYITSISGGSGAGPGGSDNVNVWESNNYTGTFTPSGTYAMPTLMPFSYNLHIRILQVPLNNISYTVGQEFIVNAVSIHP